jgi:hypothetical protein
VTIAKNPSPIKGSAKAGTRRPTLRPIGVVRCTLKARSQAPKQSRRGRTRRLARGAVIRRARSRWAGEWGRNHRGDLAESRSARCIKSLSAFGSQKFADRCLCARSPGRPNPIGLHRVTVRTVVKNRLRIGPMEATDGTPVCAIKAALSDLHDT